MKHQASTPKFQRPALNALAIALAKLRDRIESTWDYADSSPHMLSAVKAVGLAAEYPPSNSSEIGFAYGAAALAMATIVEHPTIESGWDEAVAVIDAAEAVPFVDPAMVEPNMLDKKED